MKRVASRAFLILCLAGTRAFAQPGDGDRAVTLGREGLELLSAGNFVEAYARFEQAETLSHSPVFVLYMARSKRATGELLFARTLCEHVTAESIPETAPESWIRAQSDARNELAAINAAIPSLVVSVRANGAENVELRIDGKPATPGVTAPLDPGKHELSVTATSVTPVTRPVTLAAGSGVTRLDIELEQPIAPAKMQGEPPPPPPGATRPRPAWPAIALVSIGTAGIAVGATTGLIALFKTRAIKDDCQGNTCPPEEQSRGSSADDFATVSTWSFVVGGVALAAGGALLIFAPRTAPVAVVADANGLGLSGAF